MKTISMKLIVWGMLIMSGTALAQIPRTISYQGVLSDTAGYPKKDSTYSITFRLYQASTGGSAIWTETKSLQTKRGLFSTQLGSVTPFGPSGLLTKQVSDAPPSTTSIAFDKQYWMSIQVGSDAELSPRTPLSSVPYSINSIKADTAKYSLAGGGASQWITSGSDIYYNTGRVGIGVTPSQTLDVNGNIKLPATTGWTGIIYQGSSPFMHSYGLHNFFAGDSAGNLTMGGWENTGIGYQVLSQTTNGHSNTAIGTYALSSNTSGYDNTATGEGTLSFNSSGFDNTANGYQALPVNRTGVVNTAIGAWVMNQNSSGDSNTAVGGYALLSNSTGRANTALGGNALTSNTTGSGNTALGYSANVSFGNVTNATAIGYNAKVGQSNSLVLGGTGAYAVNVGIGTTSPRGLLDVAADTSTAGHGDNVLISAAGKSTTGGSVILTAGDGGTSAGNIELRAGKGVGMGSPIAGDIILRTGLGYTGYGNFRFLNGNVGIGTTGVPSAKLDVVGTVKMTGFNLSTGTGTGKILTSDASGVGTWQTAPTGSQWTTNSPDIYYNTGNVGIGEASPSHPITVSGNIASSIFWGERIRNRDAGSTPPYSTGAGILFSMNEYPATSKVSGIAMMAENQWGNANGLNFFTGNDLSNAKMIINATGNVGIGTTTPGSKLHLYQTGSLLRETLESGDDNEVNLSLQRSGASFPTEWQFYVPASSTDLRLYNLGDRVTIQSNGFVGIGKTPSQALDVNGTVKMTGFCLFTGFGGGKVLTSDVFGVGTWQTPIIPPFSDAGALLKDASDATKQLWFDLRGLTTNTQLILTVPNANTTLVGTGVAQALENKTITGNTNTVAASQLRTTGSEVVVSAAAVPTTGQVLTATSGTAANWQTPLVSSPPFSDATALVKNSSDATKLIRISSAGATTGTTTTINANQTANRTLTLPDANTTLVGTDVAQTLTNKTISVGNSVAASQLQTTDVHQFVNVSAATPPTPGQVLTATSGTAATWQTPLSSKWTNGALSIYYNTGKVGIGTTTPDQLLTVNGGASKPGGGSWSTFSDIRLKKDISPFNDGLEMLKRINPIWFRYNGKAGYSTTDRYVGVIAQEIREVAPYTVSTFKAKLDSTDATETELLRFDPNALTYIAVNAIKELDAKTGELVATSGELKRKAAELAAKTAELETVKVELTDVKARLARIESLLTNNNTSPTVKLARDNQR